MSDYLNYVPGLPIKCNSPSRDPQQSQIPHIVGVINIITGDDGKQRYVGDTYEVNEEYYSEYSYLIKLFMKEHGLIK